MLKRLVLVVVFVPLAIVMVALAVANRAPVPLTLDPFNPGNPAFTVEIPLFFLLFAFLIVGAVLGSMITWFKQGRYRKLARQQRQEIRSVKDNASKGGAAPALMRPGA